MKKKWLIATGIIVILVILIAGNIWQQRAATNVKVETVTLTEEEMKETVITPGTLKVKDEQVIYYEPEKGEVEEILVQEGDTVEKGDELVRYKNKQLELEQRQNELQRYSTSLRLEDLRKKHRDIDKELEKDKDNDFLKQEHDDIKLQEQLTSLEFEQEYLQKEMIEEQLENLTVTSDVNGSVVSVHEEASKDAFGEKPLIQIATLKDFIVEGKISEYDTLNISVGQEVILTSDAVVGEEWKGTVSKIGDLPENQQTLAIDQTDKSVNYPITIALEEEIHLKPGFNMLIEIVTREEKVPTLPIEAVFQEDDKNYVYIVEDGKAKRVEVKVGSVDTEKIEIVEGIDEKDEVIVSPPEDLTDGAEVNVS